MGKYSEYQFAGSCFMQKNMKFRLVSIYLKLLKGEATPRTDLSVVPDGGTPDLWP